MIAKNINIKTPIFIKEFVRSHDSLLSFFDFKSQKIGIKAEEIAPRIKKLNIKSGILKEAKYIDPYLLLDFYSEE